jgi:hypothetical protein
MVKYDADARRMTVGGYLGLIPLSDGTYLDDKRVKYTERDDQTFITEIGNYVGSNAFGVTKVITKKEIQSYALGLGTENALTHGWPHNDATYSFTMAPDVALQAKDHLEVILVGKPTIPLGFNLKERFEPTLSNPSDVTKYILGSTIDVQCAALVNGADGKIIQNIK